MGLFGSDETHGSYTATQLNESYTQTVDETPGVLLGIRPYKDNQGIVDGAAMLQSLHDVRTKGFRDTNISQHHSFELWFDEEKLKFYMHAADESAANKFRRRVANSYSNTQVFRVEGGDAFPQIHADDYVAGAELDLNRHYYYPIRNHQGDGFERDPYGEVTSEMLSTPETRVVVQVVFRPAKNDWTEGNGGLLSRGESVDDVAEGLRSDRVVGWVNPRTRDASKKDREAADVVEMQRGQYGFHTNLRILAISPDKYEAESRARGVAGMFTRYYNTMTEQGFTDEPVPASKRGGFIEKLHAREWEDREMILSVSELAGAAHIPNKEIETPKIDWRYSQRGGEVPADSQREE